MRTVSVVALALSGPPLVAASAAIPPQRDCTVVIEDGQGLDEISRYTPEGRLLSCWTGFSHIEGIQTTTPGRLVVLELGRNRFVELDRFGAVHRVVSFPPFPVFDGFVSPNGHSLLAAGREGVIELDRAGRVVWQVRPPDPTTEVVGAVRLADGTTLCVVRFAALPLYQVPAGATRFLPIALEGIGPFRDHNRRPKLRVLDPAGQRVALSYGEWRGWHELEWQKGVIRRQVFRPAEGEISAVAAGGDATWIVEALFEVIRLSPSGREIGRLGSAYEVRDIAAAEDGTVLTAIARPRDPGAFEDRRSRPVRASFPWSRLAVWCAGAVLFVAVVRSTLWRRSGFARAHEARCAEAGSSAAESAAAPSAPDIAHSRRTAWIACVVIATIGVVLCAFGAVRLYREGFREAMPLFPLGALLAAGAGQWWWRVICRQRDSWWSHVRVARPPRELFVPTVVFSVLLATGGLVLWRWGSQGTHHDDRVALWVALQILCVGLAVISARRLRFRDRIASGKRFLHLAGLVLLALMALVVDLEGVPQNVHNDVGLTVERALRLLEGRVADFFRGGYAEIPYPGHLPTSFGLLLGGTTVAGSRCGGAFAGLAAVIGAYALGREYKSHRLGIFAGILLVGSIPFLHFSRSAPFGEVAAYSVWFLWALLRAVRTAHPGMWLLCGWMGGWGLFLFFSARVAIAGVVVAALLLSVRSAKVTLRRWYGPLLFLLGFAVTAVPMLPHWRSSPGAFFSRMDNSFPLYDPHSGFHPEVLRRAFGEPLQKTFGMFFTEKDLSGQGTLSPGAGPLEATLLLIGLVAAFSDGWGVNVACLGWFLTMLLGCGAFTQATPWYTRLVPVAPVVAVFMARAVDLHLDLAPFRRRLWRCAAAITVSVALVGLVAVRNLARYLEYERSRPVTEFTAFGRAALALGPKYRFYCVSFQRPGFSCRDGAFVPYLARLDSSDLQDPIRELPSPTGHGSALMIPFARFLPRPIDPRWLVEEIVRRHPRAETRYIRRTEGASESVIGAIVLVPP